MTSVRRYYVIRVVTAVGTGLAGSAAPVQLVSYLAPGQKVELSVVGADGDAPVALELAYDSDRDILVARSATAEVAGLIAREGQGTMTLTAR